MKSIAYIFLIAICALQSSCKPVRTVQVIIPHYELTVTLSDFIHMNAAITLLSDYHCGGIHVLPDYTLTGLLTGVIDSARCHQDFLRLAGVKTVSMQRKQ